MARAVKFIPGLAPEATRTNLKAYFGKVGSTTFQWAASFRDRWHMDPDGVLESGEDLVPAELKAKVSWARISFIDFLGSVPKNW